MKSFLKRTTACLLCFSLLLTFLSTALLAEVTPTTSLINSSNLIFSGSERNMPDYLPPKRDTYLVQDTFIGVKAQLQPIADFFLAQPWWYWAGQNLAGQRTRSMIVSVKQ